MAKREDISEAEAVALIKVRATRRGLECAGAFKESKRRPAKYGVEMAHVGTLSPLPETGLSGRIMTCGGVIRAITRPIARSTPPEKARKALRERAEAQGVDLLGARQLKREAAAP